MTIKNTNFTKAEILDTTQSLTVFKAVEDATTIVLTTHEGPDGDGLGSELGLARALSRLGKKVTIVNPGETLKRFKYMDKHDDLNVLNGKHTDILMSADLALLIDTAEIGRTGAVGDVLAKRTGPVLAIDHHAPNDRTIDGILGSNFPSTGELVFHVINRLGVDITADIAEPLYSAMLYDTAQFRYVRNDPEVFQVASLLVQAGADAEGIARHLFGTISKDSMLMQSRLMSTAKFELGGRLAWSPVTSNTLAGLKLDRDEIRSMVDVLGNIDGVEICVLFKDYDGPKVKISMRSRGKATVNDVAEQLGGGGHPKAAGADVLMPLDEAIAKTLPLLRAKLSPSDPK